jgi:hypothetical protein
MTTVFGTYSTDLVTALAAAMTGYTWAEGKPVDGFSAPPSSALGYVWVSPSERDDNDHLIMKITAMVRVYPVQAQRTDEETPIDPVPLYQAVDDVNAALKPGQAPGGGSPWFYEITAAAPDHDDQYVEFTVEAFGPNQFAP